MKRALYFVALLSLVLFSSCMMELEDTEYSCVVVIDNRTSLSLEASAGEGNASWACPPSALSISPEVLFYSSRPNDGRVALRISESGLPLIERLVFSASRDCNYRVVVFFDALGDCYAYSISKD